MPTDESTWTLGLPGSRTTWTRRGKGGAPAVTGKSATLTEARRLHEIVKVQRARLAYERERGMLIDAGAAERTVFARAKAERDAHLANDPVKSAANRIASRIAEVSG